MRTDNFILSHLPSKAGCPNVKLEWNGRPDLTRDSLSMEDKDSRVLCLKVTMSYNERGASKTC